MPLDKPAPQDVPVRSNRTALVDYITAFPDGVIASIDRAVENGLGLNTEMRCSAIYAHGQRMDDTRNPKRYAEFFHHGTKTGLQPKEFLLPRLTVPYEPPRTTAWAEANKTVADARALLAKVPPANWGYYLRLAKGIGTLGADGSLTLPRLTSCHASGYRLSTIWGALEKLFGGSLAGKSVLDMACNWGAFTLEGALRGASPAHGFDIRDENVAKAKLVREYFDLPQVEISQGDVFELDESRHYDIVLNLGLAYHITRPYELLQKTYRICREVAVVDSAVHREPVSAFILGSGELAIDHAASAVGCELHPTYRGLIDMMLLVGFRHIVELEGVPTPDWKNYAETPFAKGTRRCLLAFK